MEYFGMPPGKWIRQAKNALSEAQLEKPLLTKEKAFSIVKKMLKNNKN
jgi:hypothetical protein